MARNAARRYADAIISLAIEGNTLESWNTDLQRLVEIMEYAPAARFLVNPGIPVTAKRAVFETALNDAQPETRNLVNLLLERGRLEMVPDLYAAFTERKLAEQGIAIADVTTAEPLTDEDRTAVRQQLQQLVGKPVELRLHVDPDIIGGVIARVGDQLLDGSVVTKLRTLRQRLAVGTS